MQEVKKYVTFDGVEFRKKEKAEEYERLLKTLDIVKIRFNTKLRNIINDILDLDENSNNFTILVQKAESFEDIKHCLEILFGPAVNYATEIQNWDMERQETKWVEQYSKIEPRFILVTYKKDNYAEVAGNMHIPIIDKNILADIYGHYITQIIDRTLSYL